MTSALSLCLYKSLEIQECALFTASWKCRNHLLQFQGVCLWAVLLADGNDCCCWRLRSLAHGIHYCVAMHQVIRQFVAFPVSIGALVGVVGSYPCASPSLFGDRCLVHLKSSATVESFIHNNSACLRSLWLELSLSEPPTALGSSFSFPSIRRLIHRAGFLNKCHKFTKH